MPATKGKNRKAEQSKKESEEPENETGSVLKEHALLGVVAVVAIIGLVLLFMSVQSSPASSKHFSRPFNPLPYSIGIYTPGATTKQAECVKGCLKQYPYGSVDYGVCYSGCLRIQEDLGRIGGVRPSQVVYT